MDADYELKRGDTNPPLQTTLTENGDPKDLSSAESVAFAMEGYDSDVAVSGTAQVVNSKEGEVAYHWADGDTDTASLYFVEWVVTYPDGSEQTFPNDESDFLYIKDDL